MRGETVTATSRATSTNPWLNSASPCCHVSCGKAEHEPRQHSRRLNFNARRAPKVYRANRPSTCSAVNHENSTLAPARREQHESGLLRFACPEGARALLGYDNRITAVGHRSTVISPRSAEAEASGEGGMLTRSAPAESRPPGRLWQSAPAVPTARCSLRYRSSPIPHRGLCGSVM